MNATISTATFRDKFSAFCQHWSVADYDHADLFRDQHGPRPTDPDESVMSTAEYNLILLIGTVGLVAGAAAVGLAIRAIGL